MKRLLPYPNSHRWPYQGRKARQAYRLSWCCLHHPLQLGNQQNRPLSRLHPTQRLRALSRVVAAGGSILLEYWDGSAWSSIDHMSTGFDPPFDWIGSSLQAKGRIVIDRGGPEENCEEVELHDSTILDWVRSRSNG